MPSNNRRSATQEGSVETDPLTEPDDMSSSSDNYVHVQLGGRRRQLSPPVIVTPTHLRPRIKATGRDTGLVRDATFRRSQLVTQAAPPQAITDTGDDNPFLSEPLMQQLKMSSNDVAQQLTTIQPPGSGITNTFVREEGMGCVMIISGAQNLLT